MRERDAVIALTKKTELEALALALEKKAHKLHTKTNNYLKEVRR